MAARKNYIKKIDRIDDSQFIKAVNSSSSLVEALNKIGISKRMRLFLSQNFISKNTGIN